MSYLQGDVLEDIQSLRDGRGISIDRVGVKSLRFPLRVRTESGDEQPTIATIDMSVGLPAHSKGTHMSRFLQILENTTQAIHFDSLRKLIETMLISLGAEQGEIRLAFPFFVTKSAPVSGIRSKLDHEVIMLARADSTRGFQLRTEVCVAVTSLCPCSKQISKYGAHNQRSHIRIAVDVTDELTIEHLVRIAEGAASCEIYGLLKRADEKFVTERAYENPKFVEDLVRDLALVLDAEPRVSRYRLSAENYESIHNHSAYAQLERIKRPC